MTKTPTTIQVSYRLPADLVAGMDALFARDGASHSETVRRALVAYLTDRDVLKPTTTRRKATR
jgi:metal-responsive CopG/Arc/MetJ family transcriptional regulator